MAVENAELRDRSESNPIVSEIAGCLDLVLGQLGADDQSPDRSVERQDDGYPKVNPLAETIE